MKVFIYEQTERLLANTHRAMLNLDAVPRVGDHIEFGLIDGDGARAEVTYVTWRVVGSEAVVEVIVSLDMNDSATYVFCTLEWHGGRSLPFTDYYPQTVPRVGEYIIFALANWAPHTTSFTDEAAARGVPVHVETETVDGQEMAMVSVAARVLRVDYVAVPEEGRAEHESVILHLEIEDDIPALE